MKSSQKLLSIGFGLVAIQHKYKRFFKVLINDNNKTSAKKGIIAEEKKTNKNINNKKISNNSNTTITYLSQVRLRDPTFPN